MKERPIIFSSEMIRAILEGRKTQTRRETKSAELEVKHPAVHSWALSPNDNKWYAKAKNDETKQQYITTFPFHGIECPFGKVGDKLWVREAFLQLVGGYTLPSGEYHSYFHSPDKVEYVADGAQERYVEEQVYNSDYWKKRSPMHMSRESSRITLEITNIRVERLNDISERDAIDEGFKILSKDGVNLKYGIPDKDGLPGNENLGWHWSEWEAKAKDAFKKLWESLKGKDSWSKNPFVWVIEFKLLTNN